MRLLCFTSLSIRYRQTPFSRNLKNTSPHVRCGYECDASGVFRNAAGKGHSSPFVRLNIHFWRFRYSERLANCLWRDEKLSPHPLTGGWPWSHFVFHRMQSYANFVKNVLFPDNFLYVLQHIAISCLVYFNRVRYYCKFTIILLTNQVHNDSLAQMPI